MAEVNYAARYANFILGEAPAVCKELLQHRLDANKSTDWTSWCQKEIDFVKRAPFYKNLRAPRIDTDGLPILEEMDLSFVAYVLSPPDKMKSQLMTDPILQPHDDSDQISDDFEENNDNRIHEAIHALRKERNEICHAAGYRTMTKEEFNRKWKLAHDLMKVIKLSRCNNDEYHDDYWAWQDKVRKMNKEDVDATKVEEAIKEAKMSGGLEDPTTTFVESINKDGVMTAPQFNVGAIQQGDVANAPPRGNQKIRTVNQNMILENSQFNCGSITVADPEAFSRLVHK